jgi:hypothetical protein
MLVASPCSVTMTRRAFEPTSLLIGYVAHAQNISVAQEVDHGGL